ncbi:MAG: tetratricopeptide repeat protein [Ignavibacteriaceae bacterium]
MKNSNNREDNLLSEILKNFLDKNDFEVIEKKLSVERKSSSGKSTRIKSTVEGINQYKLQSKIDLLLTFAKSRLDNLKFLELLLHIGQFTIITGEFHSAVYIHEKILKETKGKRNYEGIAANAALALGDVFSRQALWQLSLGYVKKASALFKKQNDIKGAANCENMLGTIYGDFGNLNKAKMHFEKSLSLLDSSEDSSLVGKIEINLGIINNIQGDLNLAFAYYNRALLNFERVRNLKRIAEIHHNIGMLFTKKNSYKAALREFDKSISNAQKINYIQSIGMSYSGKAFIYAKLNEVNLAEAFANEALEICFQVNDKLSIADTYKIKGMIQRNLKNYSLAEGYLLTSLRINKDLKNELNQSEAEYELAILYNEKGMKSESKKLLLNALGYYKKIKSSKEIKEIQDYLKLV